MREIAINIAKSAGAYLIKHFRTDDFLLKERGMSKEVTTRYDKGSDKLITELIKGHFPEHNILAEESGELARGSDYTWIVDSLDGSGNFAASNPFFSVSIALAKKGEVILGVIYAPYLNELYTAAKGEGAFLNNNKLVVSSVDELSGSYLVACEGASQDNMRISKAFGSLYPHVKDLRKLGSASIESGFVATGRAEGYFTFNIPPWDVAAGVLLVQEAGGKVTDFQGKEWSIKSTDIIMSNGRIHDRILGYLKDI